MTLIRMIDLIFQSELICVHPENLRSDFWEAVYGGVA